MNYNPDQLVKGTDTLSDADEDDLLKKWEREYHAIAGSVVEVGATFMYTLTTPRLLNARGMIYRLPICSTHI